MNAGSSWGNVLVTSVVGLVLVPIMLGRLGVTVFGVWALLSSGLNYPIILQGAFGLAINRSVAFYRDDVEQVNRVVAASFLILLGLGVLCVLGAVILSFFLTDVFASIPREHAADARATCILVGLTLAANMVQANFSGVLMGFQNYVASNAVLSGGMILRAVLTVIFLAFASSAVSVQMAFCTAIVISTVAMIVVARRVVPGLSVLPRHIDRAATMELLRYTGHSLARSGSTIAMQTTMTLLVGWKGTATDVTIYNVASRIPGVLRGFLAAAQNVFLPAVTSLCARGESQNIKAVVKRGTHMNAVITCVAAVLLLTFAADLLGIWLRGAVPSETVRVMFWLTLAVVPGGLFEIWLPVLVGMGHLRGLSLASLTAAGAAIATQLVLMRSFCSPAMAPAVALVVVLWVKTGLWLPLYGLRKTRIGFAEYVRDGLFQPLVASAASVSVVWLLWAPIRSLGGSGLLVFGLFSVIVVFIFVAITLRREFTEAAAAVRRRLGIPGEGQV